MVPSAPSVFPTPPTGEAWHLKPLLLFHRRVFLGSDPQNSKPCSGAPRSPVRVTHPGHLFLSGELSSYHELAPHSTCPPFPGHVKHRILGNM